MTTENPVKVLAPGAVESPPSPKTYSEQDFTKAVSEGVSKATSKFQKQTSTANKQVNSLQKQIDDLTVKAAAAEAEAKVARLAGDDEEEAAKIRERMRFEKAVVEREARVLTLERKYTIKALMDEYGIPEEELDGYSTAAEMERAASAFQRQQLLEENRRLKESANGDTAAAKKPGFDVGTGKATPPGADWMKKALSKDPKEQAEFEAQVAATMRRR